MNQKQFLRRQFVKIYLFFWIFPIIIIIPYTCIVTQLPGFDIFFKLCIIAVSLIIFGKSMGYLENFTKVIGYNSSNWFWLFVITTWIIPIGLLTLLIFYIVSNKTLREK